MTVTYTAKVSTSSMGGFLRLLMRWKGSVYKLLWRELLLFVIIYYIFAFVYRFALGEVGRRRFEMVARYCEMYNNLIPLAFVLGFYVSVVLTRWWEQFNTIPWPDSMALFVTATIQGQDERGRLMRRTIMRYLCLSYVITMSSISPRVKKRFPTFQHMVDAGFMLANECKVMEAVQTPFNKYFIPLVWSTSLVTRGRKEGRIKDDYAVKTLIDEINTYRGKLGSLFNYDWISLPLVYTQVVTLAAYTFFLSCLMGRQFLSPPNQNTADIYVPVFTFLQFVFYMGWLKVAETLVNPFGEDDDDFDVNVILDRNLQVSYLIVDEMHQEHPELIKDAYWDVLDFDLPYTVASERYRSESPFLGSAMDINLTQNQKEFVGLSSIAESLDEIDPLVEVAPAEPTDIPQPRRSRRSPLAGSRTQARPLLNRFKRSTSRQSSQNVDECGPGLRRQGSLTSKDSEETGTSPTPANAQEEIFNMDDISYIEEPELKNLRESGNSQNLIEMRNLPSKDNEKTKEPVAAPILKPLGLKPVETGNLRKPGATSVPTTPLDATASPASQPPTDKPLSTSQSSIS